MLLNANTVDFVISIATLRRCGHAPQVSWAPDSGKGRGAGRHDFPDGSRTELSTKSAAKPLCLPARRCQQLTSCSGSWIICLRPPSPHTPRSPISASTRCFVSDARPLATNTRQARIPIRHERRMTRITVDAATAAKLSVPGECFEQCDNVFGRSSQTRIRSRSALC
jgi:hypothetical protein